MLGKFWWRDWDGGWMTYSEEKCDNYIWFEDSPEELETTVLAFGLDDLRELLDERGLSLADKVLHSDNCKELLKEGDLKIGWFSDNYVLLNCKDGTVVYVDHEYYYEKMTSKEKLEEMEGNFEILFQDFHTMLECLFLGKICDPDTGAIRETVPD